MSRLEFRSFITVETEQNIEQFFAAFSTNIFDQGTVPSERICFKPKLDENLAKIIQIFSEKL